MQKLPFLERVVVISASQEKTQSSTYNGAEGGDKVNETCKSSNNPIIIRQKTQHHTKQSWKGYDWKIEGNWISYWQQIGLHSIKSSSLISRL